MKNLIIFHFSASLSTLHRLIKTKTSKYIAEKTETVSRLCKTSFSPPTIREKFVSTPKKIVRPLSLSRSLLLCLDFLSAPKSWLFSVSVLFYFCFGGVEEWCSMRTKEIEVLGFESKKLLKTMNRSVKVIPWRNSKSFPAFCVCIQDVTTILSCEEICEQRALSREFFWMSQGTNFA